MKSLLLNHQSSALVQITSLTDSFSNEKAVFIIKREMIAHKYHSKLNHQIILIIAAINVDNEMNASLIASIPLAIRLPEFNFCHFLFTYFHKKTFVMIAAITIISI
jgi:hypothetical protein